jgi:acetyltransferase
MSLFTSTLDIVLADAGIDQLSILLASIGGAHAQRAAEAIAAASAKTDKPVHVAWSGRRAKSVAAAEILEAARIPVLTTPVRLAQAAAVLARFADDRRRLLPRKAPAIAMPKNLVLPHGPVTLNEAESKAVLQAFGIPVVREALVTDAQAAASALPDSPGPFAVKIVSRDIAHKT